MSADDVNLYDVLGVMPDATPHDLTQAYRRRARELHPDVAAPDASAPEMFAAIAHAYRALSDPTQRAAYDAARRGESRPTSTAAASVRLRVEPGSTLHHYRRPMPPIVAGPTRIEPNDPERPR
jgi:curved DNA-binding protein CbpA